MATIQYTMGCLILSGGVEQATVGSDIFGTRRDHVLTSLYPAFALSFDSELQQDLEQIPRGRDKTDGIEVGKAVAASILALRSGDGSAAALSPFVPTTQLGSYQLMPPNFAPAMRSAANARRYVIRRPECWSP